jgi:putative transposase
MSSDQTFIRQNFRLYPTKSQISALNQDIGNQRFIWNHFLRLSMDRYELEKKFYFYNEAAGMLISLKAEHEFLKLGDSQCLQQTLRQLDVALKSSFKSTKNKKGFPKFKQRDNTGSICYPQRVWFADGKLRCPKVGLVKIKSGGQPFPENFNSVTITRSASGKFYASFVVPFVIPTQVQINDNSSAVGIDLNSKYLMVLSNGRAIQNPKHLLKKERKLKKYQRQHARKVKGSKNREKSRIKLAKLHEYVANQQKDFIRKAAVDITKNFDIICIEDLNVKSMQKWNGRMIQSAPFGLIRSTLEWMAKKHGKHVSVIGRYVPSSKACHECGQIHENLNLKDRWFSCDCGVEIHRDLNAAINILNVGLQNYEAGTAFKACGETKVHDGNIRWVSLKQEMTESLTRS